MDAVKFLKERKRMCNYYMGIDIACNDSGCPLHKLKLLLPNKKVSCSMVMKVLPEESVRLVEEWSEANPQKTRKQDLLEKYPNASMESNGTPIPCAKHLGYCARCINNCRLCWEKPIDE